MGAVLAKRQTLRASQPKKSQKQKRGSKGEIYEGRGDGADWQRALRLSLMRKISSLFENMKYSKYNKILKDKSVAFMNTILQQNIFEKKT